MILYNCDYCEIKFQNIIDRDIHQVNRHCKKCGSIKHRYCYGTFILQ